MGDETIEFFAGGWLSDCLGNAVPFDLNATLLVLRSLLVMLVLCEPGVSGRRQPYQSNLST